MSIHKPFSVKKPGSHRPLRVAERVREELSQMIPGDLRDPRLDGVHMITITSVTLTPNLRHGAVLFLLMGEENKSEDVEAALNEASPVLRRELMHRLDSKVTPHLTFKYDRGAEHSIRVHELLGQIKS